MCRGLATLASLQWRDYRARTPGTIFEDPQLSLDLAGAYRLQEAVSRLRVAAGDRLAGYKVGCTGPGTIEQFGMAGPIRGCLFESELHRSGVTLASGSFANLAAEGEMALRIGDDGRPQKTLVELVANNGVNAGVVLPSEAPTGPSACPVGGSIAEAGRPGACRNRTGALPGPARRPCRRQSRRPGGDRVPNRLTGASNHRVLSR